MLHKAIKRNKGGASETDDIIDDTMLCHSTLPNVTKDKKEKSYLKLVRLSDDRTCNVSCLEIQR